MNYFAPSAERAGDLRRAMDRSLWDSVGDQIADLGFDPSASAGGAPSAPTSMLDYAAYFDLEFCLRGDGTFTPDIRARALAHLQQRLAADIPLEPVAATPRISNYDTNHFTADQLEQIGRWWDTEPANRMALTAAGEDEFARSRQGIARALDCLRQAAPELHGEVEIVVRDIVLAKPDGSQRIDYGGASSFALWGALTINAATHGHWTQLLQQIVHETGHNLLFAIAREEPLVKADAAVRRRSPLRDDPRPLDGIFHAAYVSAREAAALEALLQWYESGGGLEQGDADAVSAMLEASVIAFWDCVATLRDDDEGPTELGTAVLSDCEAFMQENFALEPC